MIYIYILLENWSTNFIYEYIKVDKMRLYFSSKNVRIFVSYNKYGDLVPSAIVVEIHISKFKK